MVRSIQSVMVLCLCICCIAGCGNGCAGQNGQSQVCQAIIPQERLPAGWRMLPTSEMPPSDKMPWWRQNPLLLQGSETKQLDVEGKPTLASKIWAAIYMKDSQEVVIFCFAYPTREAAIAEFDLFAKGHSPDKGLLGFSRGQDNTIVLISLPPDCPDRSVFVNHFDAIASQKQATQSVPGAN